MKKILLLAIVYLILPSLSILAVDYYVNRSNGSNITGSGTQSKPWETISYALSKITGTGHTIYVAAGLYNRKASNEGWSEIFPITMKSGVNIVGAGGEATIIEGDSTAYLVLIKNISESTTRIEGIGIRGGSPAGIRCEDSNIQIRSCKVYSNTQLGISIQQSTANFIVKVNNNVLEGNGEVKSWGLAYGISCSGGRLYVTNNSMIQDNKSSGSFSEGYGINCSNSKYVEIRNNTIKNNNGGSSGFPEGYGINVSSDSVVICNNIIESNYGSYAGAGITCTGGVSSYARIDSNTVTKNREGIRVGTSQSIIRDNKILQNYLTGIVIASGASKVYNNVIYKNEGYGVQLSSTSPVYLYNNTIHNNAGGIKLSKGGSYIKNNILSNNTGYGIEESGVDADPQICSYNLFYGNKDIYFDEGLYAYSSLQMLQTIVSECINNLSGDPKYKDSLNGDYTLLLGSPCIDAGDPDTDGDGNTTWQNDADDRDPDGSRMDLGAFYFTQTVASVTLLSPNGGENWQVGSTQNIAWTSSGVTNLKIEYTTNNGTNWLTVIGSTPASTGSYSWTVPNTSSTNCKIRISDASNATVNDISDNVFIISSAPIVTLPNATGNVGTTVTVPISVTGLGSNVKSYQFTLSYDNTKIDITSASNTGTISNGGQLAFNSDLANGKLYVAWASGNAITATSGTLLNLTVNLKAVGTSALSVGSTFLFDATQITVANGSITSILGLKGDSNGDGIVLAFDATRILQFVVGLYTPTNLPVWNYVSDVNMGGVGDGTVGAIDAAAILYYVVNFRSWIGVFKFTSVAGEVEFGKMTNDNDTYTLPINLTNTSGVRSAYIKLDLGNNLDFKGVTLTLPEDWMTASNYSNGKLYIAIAGVNPLAEGSIAFVQLTLKNKEAIANIQGSVSLNDQINSQFMVKVKEIPTAFGLSQNYPNPFNPTTNIKYTLAEDAKVTLTVYTMLGQKIKTLVDTEQEVGYYTIRWDGTNEVGSRVSSGIYIYRLSAGSFISTIKMNLLK